MNNSNKATKRQQEIRRLLVSSDFCTVEDLGLQLGASAATIRNDLALLEAQGVIKRIRGGAISTDSTPRESALGLRNALCRSEKGAIADHVAAQLVTDGMVLALDAGSTGRLIAAALARTGRRCTVITNSLVAAHELAKSKAITMYLAAGRYDDELGAFHDEQTARDMQGLLSDCYFLSPDAIDAQGRVTDNGTDEHFVKTALIAQTKQVVVVADHTKLGRTTVKQLYDLTAAGRLVTDDQAAAELIDGYRGLGITVDVVTRS